MRVVLRRLDRYVLREFVKILVLSLGALTLIVLMVHFMDHMNIFLDNDAAWSDVARHYLLQVPYNMVLTLPMGVLIATIISIGELGRHGELTAMKASGISLYRITAPLVGIGALLSLGVLVLGETIVPELNWRSEVVYDVDILGNDPEFDNFRGNFVYQNVDGYTYIVRSLFVEAEGGASADQVEIQRTLEDGTFVRINAPQMIWEIGTDLWVLRDGELRVFPPAGGERMFTFSLLRSSGFGDTPQDLLARDRDPEEMGYFDLQQYIIERDRLGAETQEERVDLQMKLSYPFANLIIVLFAIALVGSAAHADRQSATVGFGFALFLTIVFWGFLRVGQGIGYGGGLSPVPAAWLANGVFAVFGLVLMVRAKT